MLQTSCAPVSSFSWLRPNRARHASGSSRRRYRTPPPWWPLPPQRNFGAKPCPKEPLTRAWLPARAPIRSWLAAWAMGHRHRDGEAQRSIKSRGFRSNQRTDSLRLAQTLSKASLDLEGLLLAQHVVAGARELMCQRLGGHDVVGLGFFALVEAFGLRAVAAREVSRLDEGPGQIGVAVFDVALALFLAVGDTLAVHTAAVGAEVAHLGKARHRAGLQPDGGGQRLADARAAFEPREFGARAPPLVQAALELVDLFAPLADHRHIGLQRQLHLRQQPRHRLHTVGVELLDLLYIHTPTALACLNVFHRQDVLGARAHQLHALAGQIAQRA